MVNRRDNRNRRLFEGESQDKNGRYVYRYTDPLGKRKAVYSWRLTESDTTPKGKKKDLSLREKEKRVQKDLNDQILPDAGNITVSQLIHRYIGQKRGVRHNTMTNYKYVENVLAKEEFGQRKISEIKPSDAKLFLIKLQDDGKGYSAIHTIRGVLRPAFQMALDDDLIRRNPFDFQLATVVVNDSVTREAITRKQERLFLEFIQNDRHFSKYYEGIYILFHTGLRISEFVGLTLSDIDFENKTINVDHQLQRKRDMEYIIEDTKTNAGTRQIPMSDDVGECFKKIIANRKKPKVEPMIDGKTGFLYLDKNGMPMVALHWEKYFKHIREKYNSIYKEELPLITPHVCRHTFCSNMAKNGMNPKALQYIMGHSDIGVTLNVYTHAGFEDAKEEIKRMVDLKKLAVQDKTPEAGSKNTVAYEF